MGHFLMQIEDNSSSTIRVIRVILLVLIVAGITLLLTQKSWLPPLVNYLLKYGQPAVDSSSSANYPFVETVKILDNVSNQNRLIPQSGLKTTRAVTESSSVPMVRSVWQPGIRDTFYLQLTGTLVTSVSVKIYDIDLFDSSKPQITQLKQQGHKVVCYFSAGSSEDWRPDFASFFVSDMGDPLEGWAGEKWLDIRSSNVRGIMRERMDLALTKGCDGVDPDNVDGYTNSSGFPLSSQDQLDFNRFLSHEAHLRGLAIGLKNDIAQLSDLVDSFDFAINEQCHEYAECSAYQSFTSVGKPVLNIEYQSRYVLNTNHALDELCMNARAENLYTLVLPLKLDGSFRLICD